MAATSNPNEFLNSTFPVLFPSHPGFTVPQAQFEDFLRKDLEQKRKEPLVKSDTNFPAIAAGSASQCGNDLGESDTATVRSSSSTSTWAQVAGPDRQVQKEATSDDDKDGEAQTTTTLSHPFMKGLLSKEKTPDLKNKVLTANSDLAHASSTSTLVDLFFELDDISRPRLHQLLSAAWEEDPLSTLKIIFNTRSIHLGKSSREVFYRCVGWLATFHPKTCLANLKWLSRPVIEKRVSKKEPDEDDMVLVEEEKDDDDLTKFDIRNGVAHGYYKDLLNILALAANDAFDEPHTVLKVNKKRATNTTWDEELARAERHDLRDERHQRAVQKFNDEAFYRGLHITVARIFADQLTTDLKLLHSNDKKASRKISLCAKWAPSSKLFHDKHTWIASSIAELLHPHSAFKNIDDRETYLRHAREAYRKDVASLRKALQVVERDISAEKFENIKYDKVPSLAMNQYKSLFASKDEKRFDEYLDKVSGGEATISGATLLPSTLVHQVRQAGRSDYTPAAPRGRGGHRGRGGQRSLKALRDDKARNTDLRVCDAQWKTLVQRIKDSGTMESSMAVCDVSGSMSSPVFSDGSCPMDSAIGLSLLLAEVVQAPFGGAFITFSANPKVQQVDLSRSFTDKIHAMERAKWGMNTNFTAVFEDLILPMARENNVKQEDMVKRIFVFSDMHFDSAQTNNHRWSTSFERVKAKFKLYGYEMPELVFWNLAGGRAGGGRGVAPKPVTVADVGTSLVSGYSQALLKVFLDGGGFEEPEAELVEKDVTNEDGDEFTVVETKKQKMDPLSIVKKAISHQAYSMLTVVD